MLDGGKTVPQAFCKIHFKMHYEPLRYGDKLITYEEYLHAKINREIANV
jgi:hypothetical protein